MKEIARENNTIGVQDLVAMVEQGEPVVFTKAGEPRYIFGTMDDFEREVHSLAHNQEFLDYLDSLRQRSHQEPVLTMEEVRRRSAVAESSEN